MTVRYLALLPTLLGLNSVTPDTSPGPQFPTRTERAPGCLGPDGQMLMGSGSAKTGEQSRRASQRRSRRTPRCDGGIWGWGPGFR